MSTLAQIRPPNESPRVLCYSPYNYWELHGLWEITILHALRIRSAAVRYVLCNGIYSDCDMFWAATRPRTSSSCTDCQTFVSDLAKRMQMPFEWLGAQLSPEDFLQGRSWADRLRPSEFSHATYGEWKIGEWVEGSIHSHFRMSDLDLSLPEMIHTYRSYLYSGSIAAMALSRLLDEFRPDCLFLFNGRMSSTRIALELARMRDIRVIVHERGRLKESLSLRENANGASLRPMKEVWEKWGEIPLCRSELETIEKCMLERQQGLNHNWRVFSPSEQNRDEVVRTLQLNSTKQQWVLFTSSDDEVIAAGEWAGPFKCQMNWVLATLHFVRSHPEIELIIRVHPNTGGSRSTGVNVRQLKEFECLARDLPSNVRMVMPDDPISSYTLMDLASLGLAYHSTVSLEMACKGKPVVVSAGSVVTGLPFVLTPNSPTEYISMLSSLIHSDKGRNALEIQRQAYRFAYGLFYRINIPFPLVTMPNPHKGILAYKSLEDLLPGREPNLDRIAGIILDRQPVCPEPTSEELQRSPEEEDAWFEKRDNRVSVRMTPRVGGPLVSVVIPCFNYGPYLTEAVESVIGQSFQDFEIIIVNDGSTDNSRQVAEDLIANHPGHLIRLIDQHNSGQPAVSRNNGIAEARGTYILPVDADDKLATSSSLKILLDEAIKHRDTPVAVVGWVQKFGVEDDLWKPKGFDPNRILRRCTVPYCALYHRSVWERQGGYRTNVPGYEDWDFWIGATIQGVRFVHLEAPVLLYRRTQFNSLVDKARMRHEWLMAGIITNHSSVYEASEVAWAEDYRRRHPQPPKERRFSEEIQRNPEVAAALVASYPEHYAEDEVKWAIQHLHRHPFLIHKGLPVAPNSAGKKILMLRGDVVSTPTQLALAWFRESLGALQERNFPEAERLMGLYRQSIRYETFTARDGRPEQLPGISVIIVAYRTKQLLLECLNSVFEQSYRDFEVIVVDNGGNEEVHETLRSYPILHVQCPDNLILSEGRNIGVHHARGRIVAFLDDDARVPRNYLESIDLAFKAYDIVGMRGKVHPKSTLSHHSHAGHYDLGDTPIPSTIDTEGNSAFSRKAYQEVGGMNPLLFGMEGLDLSYRLAGRYGPHRTVYWPETLIYHDFAVTEEKVEKKLAQHALMREYLLYKFPDIYDFHNRLRGHAANESSKLHGKALIPAKTCSAPVSIETEATVTLAVVTYNRAKTIGRALESALNQSRPADEILVVDDGSEDKTAEVVAAFRSPRIRYIRKEHSGAPQTRNRAVAEASGDFVLWLDSDDCLPPHTVASHLAALRRTPDADVLYGNLLIVDEDLKPQKEWIYPDYYGCNNRLLARMVRGNCLPNPGTMIRKSCFCRFGGYDESFRRAHDYEFWSRLAKDAVFKHSGAVVCNWRVHANSLSAHGQGPETSYEARVVQGMLKRYPLEDLYPDIMSAMEDRDEARATCYWQAASTFLEFKDIENVVTSLQKSYECCPSEEVQALLSYITKGKSSHPSGLPESVIAAFNRLKHPPVPDPEDFDEAYYLESYPDIAQAVAKGVFRSGWEHFARFGRFSNRLLARTTWNLSFHGSSGASPPQVSVVIPCYNHAHYLREAVQSVLRQTYRDWEILVVNDGSTDDTGRVARSLIQEHGSRRIHLIEKENGGLAEARNVGVRKSRGKYILPLDADDLLEPTMIEECVRILDQNPGVAIAYTDVRQFGAVERVVPSVPYDFKLLCHMNFMCCSSLYRREAFDAVGGYNPNMVRGYEDWDFWIGCGEKGFFGEHVPKALFLYRRNANSMVTESQKYDRELKARIVLNHPAVFSPEQLSWAKGVEAKDPRIMALPDQPHFIPLFESTRRSPSAGEATSGRETGMKVLFTMYGWNDTGGGTTFPKSVARELVQRGHRVSVFYASLKNDPTMPPYSVLKEEEDGVVLYGVYNRPAPFVDPDCPEREIRDEGVLERFREVLDEVGPEVVHFHNFHGLTFALAREVRERGIPSCYTPHNYHMIDPHLYLFRSDLSLWRNTDILENSEAVQRNPGKRELYKKRAETTRKLLNEWVDMTLAVSSRQRELLVQHGARPDRVAVVHQSHASTDVLWSSPELAEQGSRPLHHPLRIGFIGGVMPHKGVHVLAAAAQHFDSSRAEFHVYGFGSIEYIRFVRRMDPGERLVFHGNYTHDMLESIARELDVAVVPSLWEDCAPLVLLELMAMRLPILGASIGGIPDFVKEGVNGFLYSHDSVESLCRCIEYCIQNRPIIRKMRSSLRRPHSFQGYVNHLMTVYRDLSSRKIGDASRYDLFVRLDPGTSRPAIRWEGSQFVIHSLALVNRELCLQLMDKGCEVSIVPFEPDQFGPEKDPRFSRIAERVHKPLSREPDLHVRHQWPPNFVPPPQGHWVMIQPWEYGRLPEDWIEPMSNLVDEIWVPSRYVLKTYLASGIPADRVRVIPNGVNTRLFHPQARPISLATRKKYKFLFLGGTIWRKGIDLLLQAYGEAFRREDDVVLVVKDMGQNSFYRGQGAGKLIGELQGNPKFPEILYLTEDLDEQQMPGLLTACDCLVHPYRGEGFGLPVLEAMACGLPVIVTAGGATDDFCTPETAYFIPSRPKGYFPNDMKLAGGALWVLEADVNALKNELRHVYEHPEEARRKGQRAIEKVASQYTWDKVAEQVTKRAEALRNRPIRRMGTIPGPVEPCAASPAFAHNTV